MSVEVEAYLARLPDEQRAAVEGLPVGKGSIRFTPDRPLPDDLVTTLVQARIAEAEGH